MTTRTTSRATRIVRRLAAGLVGVTLAVTIALVANAGPGEARPILQPCSYDDTCITTTIRR